MLIAISLWESKANTEAYNTNTYPEVLRTSARMIDGTPKAQRFDAVTSTFHHVAVAECQRDRPPYRAASLVGWWKE